MTVWFVTRKMIAVDGSILTLVVGAFSSKESASQFAIDEDNRAELHNAARLVGVHVQHEVRRFEVDIQPGGKQNSTLAPGR